MELIETATFPIMGMAAKEELNQISDIVGSYLGDDKKEAFLKACENLNTQMLNDLLDKTVEALTGNQDVYEAMIDFIDKFPTLKNEMREELSQYHFEYKQTKVFERYYKKLISIMKKNDNGSKMVKGKGLFSKRKKKSEDKDGNVDVTNAFIKSTEAAPIISHGASSSDIVTNILNKINADSDAIVTLYENQYVTGKSDSEKIVCIEKCINHIKDNYSSSKLIDLINEYVSESNNPSILSNDNDKRKLYTEKLINYLKKYEITDIMRVAIILESMRSFDNPVKMFEHFGYKNMTVDKLRKMDKKLVEQLREFDSCMVKK